MSRCPPATGFPLKRKRNWELAQFGPSLPTLFQPARPSASNSIPPTCRNFCASFRSGEKAFQRRAEVRSASQIMSLLFGEGTFSARLLLYFAGGLVRGSIHFLISA